MNLSKLKISDLILVLSVLMAVSSGTILNLYGIRYGLIAGIACLGIIEGSHYLKKGIGTTYSVLALYALLSILYSPDTKATLLYAFSYLSCAVFVNSNRDEDFYYTLFFWLERLTLVCAGSILISVVYPSLMVNLHFLTCKSVNSILSDLHHGAIAGLAGDRAEAAVLMCLGIAICWARYCSKSGDLTKLFAEMIVYYAALMLTSKRTLFICSLVIPFLVLTMYSKGKKKLILIAVSFIGVLGMMVMVNKIPALQNIFLRLQDTEDLVTMNGRTKLWNVSKAMFASSPIFGHGFNSFNLIANQSGVRYGGSQALEWLYQGHNSYLQLLGELGIVGILLYSFLQIQFFCKCIKLILRKEILRENQLFGIYFALFMMIVFSLYSITGNCLYYVNQVFIQAILYGYIICVDKESRNNIEVR